MVEEEEDEDDMHFSCNMIVVDIDFQKSVRIR